MKTRWVKPSLAASISALLSTSVLAQCESNQVEDKVQKIT